MIHYEIVEPVAISYPAKLVNVGGVDREYIVVHRNGQKRTDVTGESDRLLTVEIARKVKAVPEVVPAVDRQKGQIDSILSETFGLAVVSDRVTGVEDVDPVNTYQVAEVGIALLGVLVEFLMLGRDRVNVYLHEAQIIVTPHRVNSAVVDSKAQHCLASRFRDDKLSAG